jgi:hypothetical protein
LRLRLGRTAVASSATPARRLGTGLNASVPSCWCWTLRRFAAERSTRRGWGKLLSDLPPPMPSWRPRGPDGSAGSLRTLPSKGCTTFGRRDGRSASIPALGYLVREWWTPSVRRWPTGAGRRRGWPRRSWLMRASVPGRCSPVLPCRPSGSARSSSNGCIRGPFGADRYLTAQIREIGGVADIADASTTQEGLTRARRRPAGSPQGEPRWTGRHRSRPWPAHSRDRRARRE